MGRLSSTTGGGRLGGNKAADLSTIEGLAEVGRSAGLQPQVDKIVSPVPKLSALQRITKGLGAVNPAEAILTGTEKGVGAGIVKYGSGIVKGVGSAITGRDYEGERRTFRDVAEKAGVENAILKSGLGFVGDVLLDPSTYFGGAIARGITKVASKGASVALKGVGKVLPETEAGLRLAGTEIKDAFGKAFQFGYKASRGAKEDVMSFLGRKSEAELGLAGSNLDRLGTGVLTSEQQKELALNMVAKKRAEFQAAELGVKTDLIKKATSGDVKAIEEIGKINKELAEILSKQSADPVVQKTIDEQIARSQKMAGDIDIADPYVNYYPFIKKDKLTKFLQDTERAGIKVGSESYRKQFKNLLTNDMIEMNPAKAFFTREAQMVTDSMNRTFLQGFVKKYGKELSSYKTADEALTDGYKILKEKGMFGKELGYINKYDADLLRNSLSPEFQSINMLAKATGFDAITSLFKRSVTGLFVPFHVRNFVSGMVQNFETIGVTAFNPKLISSAQKFAYELAKDTKKLGEGIIEVGGKPEKLNKVYQAFKERFGGSSFYTNDFLEAIDSGNKLKQAMPIFGKEAVKTTAKTLGLGQEGIPFRLARTVGQYIEHQQKAIAYLGGLSQGKSIKEALNLAETAGFDYRALTRFESQIMRRIIPFYSFTRKNIELQLKTLGHNPQRIQQVLSVIKNLGIAPSEEESQNLPGYITEALSIKIGMSKEGLQEYIANFGTPIESFANLFDDKQILRTISQFNPLIKVPIELGIGKDSFRKKDLKDVYDAKEYAGAPQIIKDLLELHEVEKPVYKKVGDKLVQTSTRKEYVADPERLLLARSLFTSRGVTYLDTLFNSDLSAFSKYMKLISGQKIYEVNTEVTKAIRERDTERELEDLLIKEGKIKKFEKAYIPK